MSARKNTRTFSDLLIGEVRVYSGQSNMEFAFALAMIAVGAGSDVYEFILGLFDDLSGRWVGVELELPDGRAVLALAVDAGVGSEPRIFSVASFTHCSQVKIPRPKPRR